MTPPLTPEEILALAAKATPGPYEIGTAEGEGLAFMPLHAPTWGAFATVVVRMVGNGDDVESVGDLRPENIAYLASLDPQTVTALVSELIALRWRRIDTAPRDGTVVLTQHVRDLYPVAGWFNAGDGLWYRETEGPEDKAGAGKNFPLYTTPSHWMPLPTLSQIEDSRK